MYIEKIIYYQLLHLIYIMINNFTIQYYNKFNIYTEKIIYD